MFTGLSDNMPSPGGQPVRLYHTVELNSPSKRMADIYVLWLFICSWAITLLISQHLILPAASIVTGNLLGSPSCFAARIGTLLYCGCRSIKCWMWRFDSSLLWSLQWMVFGFVSACTQHTHTHKHMHRCINCCLSPDGPRLLSNSDADVHATCLINPLCIHTMLAA